MMQELFERPDPPLPGRVTCPECGRLQSVVYGQPDRVSVWPCSDCVGNAPRAVAEFTEE